MIDSKSWVTPKTNLPLFYGRDSRNHKVSEARRLVTPCGADEVPVHAKDLRGVPMVSYGRDLVAKPARIEPPFARLARREF